MQKLIVNKASAILLLFLAVIGIGYAFSLIALDDPRMIDGALTHNEAHWWEIVLIMLGIFSVFIIMGSSIHHAWSTGRKAIAIFIVLVWPLSLLYTLMLQTRRA